MNVNQCINDAEAAGDITYAEAERLRRGFEEHAKSDAAAEDPRGPEAYAKDAFAAQLKAEAARKRALGQMAADRAEDLIRSATDFRAPGNHRSLLRGFEARLENRNATLGGGPSVVGRRDALTGVWFGHLEEFLYETRRKFVTGLRRNEVVLRDIVREAFGEATGSPKAKAFYEAYAKVAEMARLAYNAAGGAIGSIKDWRLPQLHDGVAIARAGREAWKAFVKPRLDLKKMVDPYTGAPLSAERLDEALDVTYNRIVTDGDIDLKPSMQPQGRGMLANQRMNERFLHFKDADAWLEYHERFGGNDIHHAMVNHIHGMAKDTAALEILGPNPNAMVELMKQVVRQDHAEARLTNRKLPKSAPTDRLDRLWGSVNGSAGYGATWGADVVRSLRNVLMADQLASAAVTAVASDPWQQRIAAAFAGVPKFRAITTAVQNMLSSATRRDLHRAGLIFADGLDHLHTHLKAATLAANAHEMSKWLPDRVFMWTGLTPWTRALRRGAGMNLMMEAGDNAGKTLAELEAAGGRQERFARWMRGFGVDDAAWEHVRAAQGSDHGEAGTMIRPVDVYDRDREAALRYSEAVHAFMEESTPEGTHSARQSLQTPPQTRTARSEILGTAGMYLTYPSTVMMSLAHMVQHEAQDGWIKGAGFLASSVIGLTLAGAMAEQAYQIRTGHDPRSLNPHTDPVFWIKAFTRGGALGFYGDYLLADTQQSAPETASRAAGPLVGALTDALTIAKPQALLSDEILSKTKSPRLIAAARFAKAYTPLLRMWWAQPVTDRLIFDRLQLLADPSAYRAWERTSRQLSKKTGQGEWWRRGQAGPDRAPDFSHLFE